MDYVTDTSSLIWYLANDSKLGRKAFDAFESSVSEGTIVVPTIVLAELLYISKKRTIKLSFEDTLETIEEGENYSIFPLDSNVIRTTAR